MCICSTSCLFPVPLFLMHGTDVNKWVNEFTYFIYLKYLLICLLMSFQLSIYVQILSRADTRHALLPWTWTKELIATFPLYNQGLRFSHVFNRGAVVWPSQQWSHRWVPLCIQEWKGIHSSTLYLGWCWPVLSQGDHVSWWINKKPDIMNAFLKCMCDIHMWIIRCYKYHLSCLSF